MTSSSARYGRDRFAADLPSPPRVGTTRAEGHRIAATTACLLVNEGVREVLRVQCGPLSSPRLQQPWSRLPSIQDNALVQTIRRASVATFLRLLSLARPCGSNTVWATLSMPASLDSPPSQGLSFFFKERWWSGLVSIHQRSPSLRLHQADDAVRIAMLNHQTLRWDVRHSPLWSVFQAVMHQACPLPLGVRHAHLPTSRHQERHVWPCMGSCDMEVPVVWWRPMASHQRALQNLQRQGFAQSKGLWFALANHPDWSNDPIGARDLLQRLCDSTKDPLSSESVMFLEALGAKNRAMLHALSDLGRRPVFEAACAARNQDPLCRAMVDDAPDHVQWLLTMIPADEPHVLHQALVHAQEKFPAITAWWVQWWFTERASHVPSEVADRSICASTDRRLGNAMVEAFSKGNMKLLGWLATQNAGFATTDSTGVSVYERLCRKAEEPDAFNGQDSNRQTWARTVRPYEVSLEERALRNVVVATVRPDEGAVKPMRARL